MMERTQKKAKRALTAIHKITKGELKKTGSIPHQKNTIYLFMIIDSIWGLELVVKNITEMRRRPQIIYSSQQLQSGITTTRWPKLHVSIRTYAPAKLNLLDCTACSIMKPSDDASARCVFFILLMP